MTDMDAAILSGWLENLLSRMDDGRGWDTKELARWGSAVEKFLAELERQNFAPIDIAALRNRLFYMSIQSARRMFSQMLNEIRTANDMTYIEAAILTGWFESVLDARVRGFDWLEKIDDFIDEIRKQGFSEDEACGIRNMLLFPYEKPRTYFEKILLRKLDTEGTQDGKDSRGDDAAATGP